MTHLSKGDSPAKAALRAAGWIELAVETGPQHHDVQGHLNNAAIAQLCYDMRQRYKQLVLGPWWERVLHEEQLIVAAREAHFSFDSEGLPGEAFVGVMRYSHREGKAAIAEQRIMESRTGRVVARGWVLLLVIRKGLVIDWPEEFSSTSPGCKGHRSSGVCGRHGRSTPAEGARLDRSRETTAGQAVGEPKRRDERKPMGSLVSPLVARSASASPTTGANLKPCPLNPQAIATRDPAASGCRPTTK